MMPRGTEDTASCCAEIGSAGIGIDVMLFMTHQVELLFRKERKLRADLNTVKYIFPRFPFLFPGAHNHSISQGTGRDWKRSTALLYMC